MEGRNNANAVATNGPAPDDANAEDADDNKDDLLPPELPVGSLARCLGSMSIDMADDPKAMETALG